jgi:hypothetical protein
MIASHFRPCYPSCSMVSFVLFGGAIASEGARYCLTQVEWNCTNCSKGAGSMQTYRHTGGA